MKNILSIIDLNSSRETRTSYRFWSLLALLAVGYVGLFAIQVASDPLVQAPVVDARENLAWAERIATDTLPAEPFYRALLYPLVLSIIPSDWILEFAVVFGFSMHLLNAFFVALIARKLWRSRTAAYLSGILFAIYPVALYFSGQVLDITFATTLFLAAMYAYLRIANTKSKRSIISLSLIAGILAGAAVLARPNFLPAVIFFPVASIFFFKRGRGRVALLSSISLISILLLQGLINLQISGQFRILPWQGSYNLYASNRDNANGKYYTQQVVFDHVTAGYNTTRMESEWLYLQEYGEDAELDVHSMSQHWRGRFLEEIFENPQRWLGLMSRKVVYLLNNWEQYNNLTYAYHKARWPLLTWNPLGWGALLILASAGIYMGYASASRPRLYAIALIGCAYAAGLLLFFIGARFRLPLAPLLCVAAGGWAFLPQVITYKKSALMVGVGLLLSLISFGNWFEARDRTTFIQDELLLAKASSEVGRDADAIRYAGDVLLRDPNRQEAHRIIVTSQYNQWLNTGQHGYWLQMEAALAQIQSTDASVEFIRGVYHWRELRPDRAIQTWRAAVERYGPASSSEYALQAVGAEEPEANASATVVKIREMLQR